jgi:hypothetical protein
MPNQKDQEKVTLDTQTGQTGTLEAGKESTTSKKEVQDLGSSSVKVVLVSDEDIDFIWEECEPLIDSALKHSEGELISSDVYDQLINGAMQLWVAMEYGETIAAMITQVISYPRKRVLRVITLGGKDGSGLDKWYMFLDMVEGFALRTGCSALEAWTRKGMARKLKDWNHSYMVITKELKQRIQ